MLQLVARGQQELDDGDDDRQQVFSDTGVPYHSTYLQQSADCLHRQLSHRNRHRYRHRHIYRHTHTHVYTHDWLLGLNVLVFPTTAHRFSRLLTVFFDSCHTHACTPTHMHACAHTHTQLIIGFKFPGVPYYCKQLQQTAQSSLTAVTHTHTNTRMHARAHTHTNTHDLVVMTPLHIMQVIWKTRNFAVQPTLETKSSYI